MDSATGAARCGRLWAAALGAALRTDAFESCAEARRYTRPTHSRRRRAAARRPGEREPPAPVPARPQERGHDDPAPAARRAPADDRARRADVRQVHKGRRPVHLLALARPAAVPAAAEPLRRPRHVLRRARPRRPRPEPVAHGGRPPERVPRHEGAAHAPLRRRDERLPPLAAARLRLGRGRAADVRPRPRLRRLIGPVPAPDARGGPRRRHAAADNVGAVGAAPPPRRRRRTWARTSRS